MKNRSIITLILIAFISFNAMHISAYSHKSSQKTTQTKSSEKRIPLKKKKPEYYRPGHSDGLQNWPGKTIDAGMNTRMLPTNSASHSGNDVTF